jgi:lipoate-protein ligase A
MTSLEATLGRRPSFDEAVAALSAGFHRAHGLALEEGELSAEETELAGSLARDKYGTHDWTWSGRAPRALTIV